MRRPNPGSDGDRQLAWGARHHLRETALGPGGRLRRRHGISPRLTPNMDRRGDHDAPSVWRDRIASFRDGGWTVLGVPSVRNEPRYRVMERRDVREAVRIELWIVLAFLVLDFAIIGPRSTVLTPMTAAAAASLVVLNWRWGRSDRRRPHRTAVVVGVILLVLLIVALAQEPTLAELTLGQIAVIVVGSALLVPWNVRWHLSWLACATVILGVVIALSESSGTFRQQAILVGLSAIATSAAGNQLVQWRRERTWAKEAVLRRQRRELRETIARLEDATTRIARLEGILPICSHCRRIRDGDDGWIGLETYVAGRSAAQFSHGICPDCLARYYPGMA